MAAAASLEGLEAVEERWARAADWRRWERVRRTARRFLPDGLLVDLLDDDISVAMMVEAAEEDGVVLDVVVALVSSSRSMAT